VADGIHRIPLPLPNDGLRAVNVYALQTDDGVTLVDGGWAIPAAREVLDAGLRSIGSGVGDIRRILVTHAHRDHYTLAAVIGAEVGAQVLLGIGEKPSLDLIAGARDGAPGERANPFVAPLVAAGARELARQWARSGAEVDPPDPEHWAAPDLWLEGEEQLAVGGRTLDVVATPGHTPGHLVFADRAAGLLFAGDHVLPTITPSIGFTAPPAEQPLGDFLHSLARVRELPDLTLLPAHGPIASSTHARVDELLSHHEERLARCLGTLGSTPVTATEVAAHLPWTRLEHAFSSLDVFNGALAAMETMAHLELLVVRGSATRLQGTDGVVTFAWRPARRWPVPSR